MNPAELAFPARAIETAGDAHDIEIASSPATPVIQSWHGSSEHEECDVQNLEEVYSGSSDEEQGCESRDGVGGEAVFAGGDAPARASSPSQAILMQRTRDGTINQLLYSNPIDDPLLLRSTNVSEVLRRGCQVMGSRECTSEYWGESQQATRVKTFISHNWATPRRDKYLVLSMYFNTVPALVVACSACACCFVCALTGLLPSHVPWCLMSYTITFLLVLFFWHDVSRALGFKGPSCFLDKCCVHQTDTELKNRAIQSLAGFIYSSSEVLVIYTGTYLSRLWTMYEAASFLMLHGESASKSVHIRPTALAKIMVCVFVAGNLYCCGTFYIVLNELRGFASTADWEIAIYRSGFLALVVHVALSMLARAWYIELARMHDLVESFHLSNASCAREEDRAFVQRSIAHLMKQLGVVDAEAHDAAAHAEFERLVREKMPVLFTTSFGRLGIKYSEFLLLTSTGMALSLDQVLVLVDYARPWQLAFGRVVFNGCIIFLLIPLAWYMVCLPWKYDCMLRVKGSARTALAHLVVAVPAATFYMVGRLSCYYLALQADISLVSLGALACLSIGCSVVTFWAYRTPPRPR